MCRTSTNERTVNACRCKDKRDVQNPIFHDETKAREALEAVRWPEGPICPHCGVVSQGIVKVAGTKKSHRPGVYYCNSCKGQFTVTVGTVFERSKLQLSKWWLASHLMGASKKGVSARQLHRMLGVTYKTAWFMAHRIREGMAETVLPPMGGGGKVVEVDETFIGPSRDVFVNGKGWQKDRSPRTKRIVVSLVERAGRARSIKVEKLDAAVIDKLLTENLAKNSRLHTDEAHIYKKPGKAFASHESVNHSEKEYARRRDDKFGRGVFLDFQARHDGGIYQHCGEQHLHRYLAEFDFRYSNRAKLGIEDAERVNRLLQGIGGKRLTYRRISQRAAKTTTLPPLIG